MGHIVSKYTGKQGPTFYILCYTEPHCLTSMENGPKFGVILGGNKTKVSSVQLGKTLSFVKFVVECGGVEGGGNFG